MKPGLFLAAMAVMTGASAADIPAALKPTQDIARVMKIEDLIHGTVKYRVDFCEKGDCDMFQTDAAHASELADYGQLFLSTHSEYLNSTPKQLDPAAVASALSRGAKQYGCAADKDQTKCVMHALFKAGKLKRYALLEKDATSYEEVDEDGQYLPGGYD